MVIPGIPALISLASAAVSSGQALSVRPDVLPEAFLHEFREFQDCPRQVLLRFDVESNITWWHASSNSSMCTDTYLLGYRKESVVFFFGPHKHIMTCLCNSVLLLLVSDVNLLLTDVK